MGRLLHLFQGPIDVFNHFGVEWKLKQLVSDYEPFEYKIDMFFAGCFEIEEKE